MASPVRTCAGCRARRPKDELIRVVRGPDGAARLDEPGLGGRGAYTCPDEGCIRRAFETGRLRRVLRVEGEGLPATLPDEMLQKVTKGRLGGTPEGKEGRVWQSRGFTK
ncbi:MAG: YlxR family protein [Actinomycetota bacterium]|nr:YlxR family protein [Actinomycetota bacterium]